MLTGAWLLALLMAGAPLAAMAGGGDGGDGEDHGKDPSDPSEADPADTAPEGADPGAESTLPTDYEFILCTGGDHVIAGFRPGTDTLILTSDSWDFDLFEAGSDEAGVALEIRMHDSRATLRFPDLGTLPFDDIHLHVAPPATDPIRIALRDALEPEEGTALQPADPDATDELPAHSPAAPPLSPTDPDAPEDDTPAPAEGAPLAPADPDRPDAAASGP